MGVVSGLFVPGLAVRGRLYWPGVPADWLALDPPGRGVLGVGFRPIGGGLLVRWSLAVGR